MDPQPFVRLSVGQLGLKLPGGNKPSSQLCHCEIRLGGFPVQSAPVPLLHDGSDLNLDPFANAAVFSLAESDLNGLATPACFRRAPRPLLDVAVYVSRRRRGGHCGGLVGGKRLVGVVRVEIVGAEQWREGKPVLLRHGWVGIGRGGGELHLRVVMEADPRYVLQFDDEVALSPQVVQVHHGSATRQPVFSCRFTRGRPSSQTDPLGWSSGEEKDDAEMSSRREVSRKGWKVAVHDLSGSAVAAAFMATPFVPAPGCDRVARSNPGAWLIVRADTTTGSSDSWQPWGRLEAWREREAAGSKDTVRLRLHLLPERQDECVLVSDARLRSDRGGEFAIDMDRSAAPGGGGDDEEQHCVVALGIAGGGFVMSCVVQGEAPARGSGRPPLVQLAARHIACMEDAAMFVALAAAVDLSVKACRPFRRKTAAAKKPDDPLELDT